MTSRLAICDDGFPVFIERVDGPGSVRFHTPLGQREMPHASAAGKAILATMTRAAGTRSVRPDRPAARGPAIPSPTWTPCWTNLALVRSNGFAIDDEEDAEGIFCLGAAIFGHDGAVAGAVSVTGIKGDLPAWRINELGQAVRRAADEVSEILGGPRYADRARRIGEPHERRRRSPSSSPSPARSCWPSAPGAGRGAGRDPGPARPGRAVRHRPGDHRRRRSTPPYVRYPIALGHEWTGIVTGDSPLAGSRVVVEGVVACGHCARCARGETNLCETYDEFGFTRDGAAAGLVAVPTPLVHPIAAGVAAEDAVLTEPAAVVYRGLTRAAIAPGSRVLVIGDGTIALLAVYLVRLWSPAEVVLLGRRAAQAELAAARWRGPLRDVAGGCRQRLRPRGRGGRRGRGRSRRVHRRPARRHRAAARPAAARPDRRAGRR